MALTLVDENDLLSDQEMMVAELALTARSHYERNQKIWDEYLLK